MVRSRDRAHLEALQERFPELAPLEVIESPHNDYRFRLFVARETWAVILGKLVLDVDYDNFKNAVGAWQGKQGAPYKDALSSVWGVMYDYQRRKHGPGIYDRLKDEHEGGLFDEGNDLFTEEVEEEEIIGCLDGMAPRVPEPDDEVLLVTDDTDSDAPVVGVIWWPDNWTSPEEAYTAAVQSTVLPLVGRPIFTRVEWGRLEDDPDQAVPVYDFEAQDVPSADDVIG